MKLGELLEALFRLSRKQKTDYAVAIGYVPSEISKYVSGDRLPPAQRMNEFIGISAGYFADALWKVQAADSLHEIFPVMKEIAGKEDLASFLGHALHYSYLDSLPHNEPIHFGFTRNEVVLRGSENISNHVHITLSDALRRQQAVNAQTSLWFFLHYLSKPAKTSMDSGNQSRVNLRVMLNQLKVQQSMNLDVMLQLLERMQHCCLAFSISFWMEEVSFRQPYFHLEGYFLMTINEFLESAPYATKIHDQSYLFQFNIFNSGHATRKIDYRMSELDLESPAFRSMILEMLDECEALFVFGPIGFVTDMGILAPLGGSDELKAFAAECTARLLSREKPMLVSAASLDAFSSQREVIIPMLGRLSFTEEQATEYILGLAKSAKNNSVDVHLTRRQTYPLGLAVLKNFLLFYTPGTQEQEERFLLLPKSTGSRILEDFYDILNHQSITINEELLNSFLKAIPHLLGKGFMDS